MLDLNGLYYIAQSTNVFLIFNLDNILNPDIKAALPKALSFPMSKCHFYRGYSLDLLIIAVKTDTVTEKDTNAE